MRKAAIALVSVALVAIAVAGIYLLRSPADDTLGIGNIYAEERLEAGNTRIATSITNLSTTELGVISPYVDAEIEQLVTSNDIPSFQAGIVLDGQLVWAKGYGEQPDLDTVF